MTFSMIHFQSRVVPENVKFRLMDRISLIQAGDVCKRDVGKVWHILAPIPLTARFFETGPSLIPLKSQNPSIWGSVDLVSTQ